MHYSLWGEIMPPLKCIHCLSFLPLGNPPSREEKEEGSLTASLHKMQWLGLFIFFSTPRYLNEKKNLAVLILSTARDKDREFFPLSTFPTSVTSLTEGKKEKKVLGGSLLLLVFWSNFLLLLLFFSHKGSGRTGVTLEARKGKRRRRKRWQRFCWLRSFLFLLFWAKLGYGFFPRPPRPRPPPSAETSTSNLDCQSKKPLLAEKKLWKQNGLLTDLFLVCVYSLSPPLCENPRRPDPSPPPPKLTRFRGYC